MMQRDTWGHLQPSLAGGGMVARQTGGRSPPPPPRRLTRPRTQLAGLGLLGVGLAGPHWASLARPLASCLGRTEGSDRHFDLELGGSLRLAGGDTYPEGGRRHSRRLAGWGGGASLECVLGWWPALRWPDCRQAQACLLGLVPRNGLPGSLTFPLETKGPASSPGPSVSRRAQTHLPSAPWTSTWASDHEAPLLAMPFPRGPLCTFCVSGAQAHVHFKACTGPHGWGLQLSGVLGLTPMAESRWPKGAGNGWPQGRSPGPWVQPHWQRPLGEEAGPGGMATDHVHSSPKDGSPPCLVVSSWQDSRLLTHSACWNPTNAPPGSPGGPGPAWPRTASSIH
ncbi:uncharacterized protein LOC125104334 [Lutra lutra]|uniref:uncharacterized protein LOC125104334 n=1 Tax=Lutra lutra TaxID=9657 RepID=UPI001FD2BF32|nr:uncharacterized protein LOC125104334 [Lutra lutra]